MAYNPKPASYYFRENKAGREWLCTKFLGEKGGDTGEPSDTYVIRVDGNKKVCSCPASWGGRKSGGHEMTKPCKHLDWLARWQAMYANGRVAPSVVVYYNSKDDRFYPVPGLSDLGLQQDEDETGDGETGEAAAKGVGDDTEPQKEDQHPGAAFMHQDDTEHRS